MTLFDELTALVSALDEANLDYALAGALALAVWGVPRATRDIDLLVRPEALDDVRAVARARGFTLEAQPMKFSDGMELRRIIKVESGGAHLTLDLILVDDNLKPAWESRLVLEFGEGKLRVISRDALIAMKAAASRPQDLADIARLRELDR